MTSPSTLWFLNVLFVSLCSTAGGKKHNVLFVLIDDLRPVLGCYGDKHAYTPNIDILAEKSAVFTKAYAQQALCGPSRTSLLTSRDPQHLKQYDVHQYWRTSAGNFTSLPQIFREKGYITASIGKVFHPGKCSNFSDDQPYSWSEVPFHPATEKYKNAAVCPSLNGSGLSRSVVCPVDVSMQPGRILPDMESLHAARDFLQRFTKSQMQHPFFLAVGLHKPHIPLKFPRKYLSHHPLQNVSLASYRWRPPSQPPVAWNPWLDVRKRDDVASLNITFPWESMPDHWAKIMKQSYYASVSYVDDLIGKLLFELQRLDLQNDTVVVLTSDHGWSLGEHGEWSKYSNYEVATRVPLLISTPGFRGTCIDDLVELLDIFPTLVDLTEVTESIEPCSGQCSQKLCTDGRSLLPLLRAKQYGDEVSSWRDGAFSLYPRPSTHPTKNPDSDQPPLNTIKIMGYSIRTNQHRYTEWVEFDLKTMFPNWTNVVAKELYDHQIDPEENLNLNDREALVTLQNSLSSKLRNRWS